MAIPLICSHTLTFGKNYSSPPARPAHSTLPDSFCATVYRPLNSDHCAILNGTAAFIKMSNPSSRRPSPARRSSSSASSGAVPTSMFSSTVTNARPIDTRRTSFSGTGVVPFQPAAAPQTPPPRGNSTPDIPVENESQIWQRDPHGRRRLVDGVPYDRLVSTRFSSSRQDPERADPGPSSNHRMPAQQASGDPRTRRLTPIASGGRSGDISNTSLPECVNRDLHDCVKPCRLVEVDLVLPC